MKRFILFALALSACKWTDFDDLSDQAWAHSQGKPSIGSTDYGVSIVGASTTGDGGLVSVVSTDSNVPSRSASIAYPSSSAARGVARVHGRAHVLDDQLRRQGR